MLRKPLFVLFSLVAALSFMACGGSTKEEKKPTVQLQPVEADVKTAEKTGTDDGHPIIEITGMMPGTGWTPEVKFEKTPEGVHVRVMAVPGPGATQGAPVPFTQKVTVSEATAGVPVKVWSGKLQIKRIE